MNTFMITLMVSGWRLEYVYDRVTPQGVKVRLRHPYFPGAYMSQLVQSREAVTRRVTPDRR